MLYFLVRVAVYTAAVWLTLNLLPGLQSGFNHEVVIDPATPASVADFVRAAVPFIYYIGLGVSFWFWNWLFWPAILAITGSIVLWSFGLLLVAANAVLFYFVAVSGYHWVRADNPVWLWCLLGGLSMTFWLVLLEGITGLDSPLRTKSSSRRRYWRIIGKLSLGGRNFVAENIRIAQSLEIIVNYFKDIAFDSSPFGPIRRFFQRIIYWRKKPLIDESVPETVRYMLQELGPTYVKLGQIVSSRAEQLPPEWRDQLAKLQNDVEPFPYQEARQIILRELGSTPEVLYGAFEHQPFAAASTAQVHRAKLNDGTPVVVKVQRPDIDVTVRADLNVIGDMTKLVERRFTVARNADLGGMLAEYAGNILLELDYVNEACNGQILARNMEVFPTIHVPHVYAELSTQRVMTQEFVKGVKITNVEAIDAAGLDRTLLATTFMRAIVKQVLYDGFFHGDPHPGNVLVNLDSGQIIFLDLGMVGTLTKDKRMAIADLLWSLSSGDNVEIAKTVLRLCKSFKPVDEQAFIEEVDRLLTRYTALGGNVSIGGAMKALFDALYNAGLHMDPQLTLALKAIVQAEETVRRLDPDLPLVDTAFSATKELLLQTFDANEVIGALRTQLLRSAKEAIRNIPSIEEAASSWIEQFRKGRFTVYVDTTEASRQIEEFDKTLTTNVRRLTLALLLVGLLISASIASTTRSDALPDLPELAYFIFIAAAVMAGAVLVRAIWNWLNGSDL